MDRCPDRRGTGDQHTHRQCPSDLDLPQNSRLLPSCRHAVCSYTATGVSLGPPGKSPHFPQQRNALLSACRSVLGGELLPPFPTSTTFVASPPYSSLHTSNTCC